MNFIKFYIKNIFKRIVYSIIYFIKLQKISNQKKSEKSVMINFKKNNIEVDLSFYKKNYPDLSNMDDDGLLKHYFNHGYKEGRLASPLSLRGMFLGEIKSEKKTLEIGPFNNPLIKGEKVKYIDVLDKKNLIERAKNKNFEIDNIPEIDYVSPTGDLEIIEENFDIVVSSHNIEHQPNLIKHLNNVSNILNDKGKYFLIIPNCKYCFDANLPVSKISDILNAKQNNLRTHSIGSIVEHYALTTHNESKIHWDESLEDKKNNLEFINIDPLRIKQAIEKYELSDGEYIDVHAWQFTPYSFAEIINTLINLNEINFKSVKVYGPLYGSIEFNAIISK